MFFKRRPPASTNMRPSKAHQLHRGQSDQLPFLTSSRFSALPQLRALREEPENLTLFIAILYVIDLFGVLPFVTLPGLLVQLGFFGVPLVISVIVLQIYTSFLLSRCWIMAEAFDPSIVQKSRYPYAAIAELAYGKYISMLVTVLLDVSIFSMGIPNLVIGAQNIELVGERITDDRFVFSFCYWLLILGVALCPMMWLASPKHMRGLAILSVWVVIIILALLTFSLFEAEAVGKPFGGISTSLPPFFTILNSYSVMSFQFDIHPMLLTLQIDMQQKSQVYWAAFSGIIITCSIAIFLFLIAAYKFGSFIADNLLESLPKSVPLYIILILMSIQLLFSSTVGSSAMFLQIENYFKIPESFSLKRVAIRSSVVALQVLIAEFVPSFEMLMGIAGGTITGPLVFILPPLLYRRLRKMERVHQRIVVEAAYGSIPLDLNYQSLDIEMEIDPKHDTPSGTLCKQCIRLWRWMRFEFSTSMLVLIFGILAAFFATYLNAFKITELFKNNSPCFYNLTHPYSAFFTTYP